MTAGTAQTQTTAAIPSPTGFSYTLNSDGWPFIVVEVVVKIVQTAATNTTNTVPLILQITGTQAQSVPFVYIGTSGAQTDFVTLKAVFTDANAGDVVQFNIGPANAADATLTVVAQTMIVWGSS